MNLFTYGSLMAQDIMDEVTSCRLASKHVVLDDYQRYAVKDEEYPGMVEEKGSRVEGVLYFDVPPFALSRLDIFEGDLYSRLPVIVNCPETGEIYEAMAYVVKPEFLPVLTSEVWDYKKFMADGKEKFINRYCGFTELK